MSTALPRGGCSIPPCSSQCPMGWISLLQSTKRQKSFLLSEPSSLSLSLGPRVPTTVAMQVEVRLRGSSASSFMPILNSFLGGILCCGRDKRESRDETQTHNVIVILAPMFRSNYSNGKGEKKEGNR